MAKRISGYALILIITLLVFPLIMGGRTQFASAAASPYSNVLDDLKRDSSFNAEDYPTISGNYRFEVKQIAESAQGELLIYVYQPAADKAVKATSIDISRQKNGSADLSFVPYDLEYLNATGVFFKYRVQGFELETSATRYYNISNILRPFLPGVDKEPADGQTVSEVGCKVGQLWTVETVGDNVTYTLLTSEVITITQKVVGYCYYDDGLDIGWGAMQGATKAYFVAFDTDRPIDKLISADLTFYATKVKCKFCVNSNHDHGLFYDFEDGEYIDYGTGVYNDEPLTITDKQTFSNIGGGNWAGRPATKYLKKRIRKTEDFIADENNEKYVLTAGDKLIGTKWVLNFYEAQDKYKANNIWLSFIPGVNLIHGVADGEAELNNVFDVQILRLEFETDGKPYNIGVVDNKQSGNTNFNEPIYKGGCASCAWLNVLPWWAWVLIIIFAPLIIFLLFKLIVKLVTAPFKAFGRRRSEKRVVRAVAKQSKPKTKHIRGATRKHKRKNAKKGGKK